MSGYILLAVLMVTSGSKYDTAHDFIMAKHISLSKLCASYHANSCLIRKESTDHASIEGLGLAFEPQSYQWLLYGKRSK